MNTVKIIKVKENAKIPVYSHAQDAGADLIAAESATIPVGERVLISTGLVMDIPEGFAGLLWDRSSMGRKGIKVFGGVIDSRFHGTVGVILGNFSKEPYHVAVGDRIAQILFQRVFHINFEEVTHASEFSSSERGEKGFGSTGK